MKLYFLILLSTLFFISCQKDNPDPKATDKPNPKLTFTFDRSVKYTLAPPIKEGDKWVESFKKGHGYASEWETWVWRKTNIDIGKGITVYARAVNETQFLIEGIPDLDDICIDFKDTDIGEDWSFGASHTGSKTPSGNYIVVIPDNPRLHLAAGMSLKERYKTDRGWDYKFNGDKVRFWKR